MITLHDMSRLHNYTTIAQRNVARFPLLTYIGTQVNFWIIANVLLVIIMYLQAHIFRQTFNTPAVGAFGSLFLTALILGILYGVTLGLIGYYLDRKIFWKLSFGKVILFKALGLLLLLTLLLLLIRFILFSLLISPSLYIPIPMNRDTWRYLFYLLLIYYFFMTLLISFISQVNDKYGPGVLIPLLLGRYRTPKEEDRIFMFMDLKSSTSIAEKLGHLEYSSFIRDCFKDINTVLFPFSAQVYQYVGDEIVVMWPKEEGLKEHQCIRFYFACKKQFQKRAEYYSSNYGLIPDFKAGVHMGTVSAVEIGEIKKDIAYHGDTLNTAARIQSICNEYQKSFLVSKIVIENIGTHPSMTIETLGMIHLKGKSIPTEIVSIEDFYD